MVWTNPKVWTNVLVSATDLNTYISANDQALKDYLTGAQDLGANYLFQNNRSLSLSSTGVGHGMTAIAPTTVYGSLASLSAAIGGLTVLGLSDIDVVGVNIQGINGSATGVGGAIQLLAQKRNGTTAQAIGTGVKGVLFNMGAGASVIDFYGEGGANFAGGVAVGYAAAPATGQLTVGDANFKLWLNGATPRFDFDLSVNSFIDYDRTADHFRFAVSGTEILRIRAGGLNLPGVSGLSLDSGGASAEGGVVIFRERADATAPAADLAALYCKDNGAGKTQIVARFSSGAVQVIATQP